MLLCGIIGYPLRITYSPTLHNSAFNSLNIKGYYFPMRISERDLPEVIKLLKILKFRGVNITNPYKTKIIKFLDGLSPLAREIGAVNTIIFKGNKLLGENTDVYGFEQSLRENGVCANNKRILIIGAGGVCPAIVYILKKQKPFNIYVANRTLARAEEIARKYNSKAINIRNIKSIIKEIDMVINATPRDFQKFIISALKKGALYYDTNYCYKPLREKHIRIINGISMLVHQAARSFSLWTGRNPPVEIMRNALKEAGYD